MSRTAWIIVVIVAMAVLFPICFVREHNGYKLASARAVTTAPDPAQQWVVWSELEKDRPAHYINTGRGGIYFTACGQTLSGATAHIETVEKMESEGRTRCEKCRKAMRVFADRSAGDQRYIDIQKRALKLEETAKEPKRSK